MQFQLPIRIKMLKNNNISYFKSQMFFFIMLIKFKMPITVGILTSMSMINFMFTRVEHEKFHNLRGLIIFKYGIYLHIAFEKYKYMYTNFGCKSGLAPLSNEYLPDTCMYKKRISFVFVCLI